MLLVRLVLLTFYRALVLDRRLYRLADCWALSRGYCRDDLCRACVE